MLLIIADENIASALKSFRAFGEVRTISGRSIERNVLAEADVLLVRSVTPVDTALLRGTPVRFVGTATAGVDHLDIDALEAAGIRVVHAPGSNAPSVCDYVLAALLRLAVTERRRLEDLTCAVVGCGHVGGRLSARLSHLGLRVLQCDPPLNDRLVRDGKPSPFIDMKDAITEADVVSLHVPLHDTSPYSTFDLINRDGLDTMQGNAWLINTSRGGVVNEDALLDWLDKRPQTRAVIDVWEGEPLLNCRLARAASVATPHIAGYAYEGKIRATRMLQQAVAEWLQLEIPAAPEATDHILLGPDAPGKRSKEEWLCDLALSAYDISADDTNLRTICQATEEDRPRRFDAVRRTYPVRHEFSRFAIDRSVVPSDWQTSVSEGLGMKLL